MRPVGIDDPRERERNENETGVKVNVGFDAIEDIPPILQANVAGKTLPVADDDTVEVPYIDLSEAVITVTNMTVYDTIEWHYNSSPVADGATLILGSQTAIFDEEGIYPVTVIGKKAGVLYSTLFYVNVES